MKWSVLLLLLILFITGCTSVQHEDSLTGSDIPQEATKEISQEEIVMEERSYNLPDKGELLLNIPINWNEKPGALDKIQPTIKLSSEEKNKFLILITPMWDFDDGPLTFDLVKKMATDLMGERALTSVNDLSLTEIKEENIAIYYFTSKDKNYNAEDPEDYPYASQGFGLIDDFVLYFTILSREDNKKVIQQGINVIKTGKLENTDPLANDWDLDKTILSIRDENWVTLIDLEGFEDVEEDSTTLPSRFLFQTKESDSMVISAFAEIITYLPSLVGAIPDTDETDICWAHYSSQMGIDPTTIIAEERNGMIIIPQTQGSTKHMNAYVYHEEYCFDFHLSKSAYKEEDLQKFYEVIDSIEFVPLEEGMLEGKDSYIIESIEVP